VQIWEIINRERRSRKGVNERIGMRKWKEYFICWGVGNKVGRARRGKEGRRN